MINCEDCHYFDRALDIHGKPNDYGVCRVNPPQFLVMPKGEGTGDFWCDPREGYWPQVRLLDCCGKGVMKP